MKGSENDFYVTGESYAGKYQLTSEPALYFWLGYAFKSSPRPFLTT